MAENVQTSNRGGWLEASGLRPILRTLRISAHPAKLGIALVAVVLTLVLGSVLDAVWSTRGGIEEEAISHFIQARELDQHYEMGQGTHRIFEVWRRHEQRCVLGLLGSALPGASVAEGTPVGSYFQKHSRVRPLRHIAGLVYGVWWFARYNPFYFLFFGLGTLLIWSLAGGAICRLAAVEIARDERLPAREALTFARGKWFGGFFFAPCIPLGIVVVTLVLMVLGGIFLRIPLLGDIVGGLAFGLAILGGFVVTSLLLGLMIGGHLFWPAVAVEGSDAFDAFSRGVSYPLFRPWKALLYATMSVIYAGLCWMVVNLFTFYMLKITHVVVARGANWFGLWPHGLDGSGVSKLDVLWPWSGLSNIYTWPDSGTLRWWEWPSALLIGLYVLLVVGLMWSFLASFYYSGSTVVYFLLRRDLDGTDLDDIYIEEEEEPDSASSESQTWQAAPATDNEPSPIVPNGSTETSPADSIPEEDANPHAGPNSDGESSQPSDTT